MPMAEELRLPAREISASKERPPCLNCGAPLAGPFCSECGQRDIPPYPSTRELAVDAISEFSGWDGRLASTIRALVTKPGMLTLEFLEGRRVRYISPLRLYLTASVIYFLLAAGAPSVRLGEGVSLTSALQVSTTRSTTKTSRPQRVADATRESLNQQELTQQQKDSALADIARA